jgi:hypothetical protein
MHDAFNNMGMFHGFVTQNKLKAQTGYLSLSVFEVFLSMQPQSASLRDDLDRISYLVYTEIMFTWQRLLDPS